MASAEKHRFGDGIGGGATARGKDVGALVRLLVYAKHEADRLKLEDAAVDIDASLHAIVDAEGDAIGAHVLE